MNPSSDLTQNASPSPDADSKFPPYLRAAALGALVLLLWAVHKFVVGRAPVSATWRYIIGAAVVSVWLAGLILISQRMASKDS